MIARPRCGIPQAFGVIVSGDDAQTFSSVDICGRGRSGGTCRWSACRASSGAPSIVIVNGARESADPTQIYVLLLRPAMDGDRRPLSKRRHDARIAQGIGSVHQLDGVSPEGFGLQMDDGGIANAGETLRVAIGEDGKVSMSYSR